MILLIALQSVGSLADAHSAHQSGIEHLVFEHDHDQNEPVQTNDDKDTDKAFDCHHCCHCHGAHSNFINAHSHLIAIYSRSPQHSYHKPLAIIQSVQSLFRPPRFAFDFLVA